MADEIPYGVINKNLSAGVSFVLQSEDLVLDHDPNVIKEKRKETKLEDESFQKNLQFIDKCSDSLIKPGSCFSSIEDLEREVQHYQIKNKVKLYRRDSRTIENLLKRNRTSNKTYSPKLKFGELTYKCKYGGREFATHSKGIRFKKRFSWLDLFYRAV